MGLSCPHFILFPKGEGVKPRCFLLRSWPVCVYDACGKSSGRFIILRQIRLLSVFFTVRVAFIVDLVVGHVCSTSASCV